MTHGNAEGRWRGNGTLGVTLLYEPCHIYTESLMRVRLPRRILSGITCTPATTAGPYREYDTSDGAPTIAADNSQPEGQQRVLA